MVRPRLKGGAKGKIRPWMLKRVQHDEPMRQRAERRIPTGLGTDRHSEDGEAKMVVFRDPERSVLMAHEHRKREKPPFAGGQS